MTKIKTLKFLVLSSTLYVLSEHINKHEQEPHYINYSIYLFLEFSLLFNKKSDLTIQMIVLLSIYMLFISLPKFTIYDINIYDNYKLYEHEYEEYCCQIIDICFVANC